jgi:transcription factor Dp-1
MLPGIGDVSEGLGPGGAPGYQRKRRHSEIAYGVPADLMPVVEEYGGNGKKRFGRGSSNRANAPAPLTTAPASSDKASKGLRHFSMKVCKKVEEKQTTSYNEVADELVNEFLSSDAAKSPGEKPAFDEKNIRRRVYDALNVLMAMDIISKEKKEIKWIGLPSNAHKDKEQLEKEKDRLGENIRRKREHLQQLIEQQVTYQNLVKRNAVREAELPMPAQDSTEDLDTKIALPFIVINTDHQTMIQCEMTESRNAVMFQFSAPFEINDDNEILKRLGLHQAEEKELRSMFGDRFMPYVPESVFCCSTAPNMGEVITSAIM